MASRFVKMTINEFEEDKKSLGERSWTVESAIRNEYRTDPLKEWALFSLAGYINGCRSSMKQNAIHFEFVHSFIAFSGRDFTERGVFTTQTEYEQMGLDRTSEYFDALRDGDAEQKIKAVARKFLINVGCNPNDITTHMVAVSSFVNASIYTKKMFDDLQKSYRLISDSEKGKH